jgi:hypothetical protein
MTFVVLNVAVYKTYTLLYPDPIMQDCIEIELANGVSTRKSGGAARALEIVGI